MAKCVGPFCREEMRADDFLPPPKGSNGKCWACGAINTEETGLELVFDENPFGIKDYDNIAMTPEEIKDCKHPDTYVAQDLMTPNWYRYCKRCGGRLTQVYNPGTGSLTP